MDQKQQIDELLRHYLNNTGNTGDSEAFWKFAEEKPGALDSVLDELWQQACDAAPQRSDAAWEVVRQQVYVRAQQWENKNRKVVRLQRYWAAASIILLLAASTYFVFNRPVHKNNATDTRMLTDIAPGKSGAVLTLGNGQKIVLDSLQNGVVTIQNGAKIILQDGQLGYNPSGRQPDAISYNVMTTPKGRQFRILLPDGTAAWLNAASSIRYPTVFNSRERNVEVTGEVYLEVAKNERMPFIVTVNNKMKIQVLGTSFNVNAYTNESLIKTTLLDGAVRLITDDQQVTLKPGQQGLQAGSGITVSEEVDREDVMAWKNGIFNFQDKSLPEIMRQLERWYDIEVIYEGGVPTMNFYGQMGRDVSLSKVLFFLKGAGVNYRMENARQLVIVSTKNKTGK